MGKKAAKKHNIYQFYKDTLPIGTFGYKTEHTSALR